jgi:hypothetical protein
MDKRYSQEPESMPDFLTTFREFEKFTLQDDSISAKKVFMGTPKVKPITNI